MNIIGYTKMNQRKSKNKLTVVTDIAPQKSFREVFGSFSPQLADPHKISMKDTYCLNSARPKFDTILNKNEMNKNIGYHSRNLMNSPTQLFLRTVDDSKNLEELGLPKNEDMKRLKTETLQGMTSNPNLQSLSPLKRTWSNRRGGLILDKMQMGRSCMSPNEVPKKVYNKVNGNKEFFSKIKNAASRVSMFQKRPPKNKCKTNRAKTIDAGVKVNRIQKQMNLHIQRAIKKTYQQENESMVQRMNEQAGEETYYERIYNQMKAWRKGKEVKDFIRKPMEVPEDLNEKPFDIFLGVKPEHVIVNKDTENWIDKHRHIDKLEKGDQRARAKKTIQFAKDLFLSWDDDGSGVLEEGEIIKPLLSLGLANDSDFCKQLLSSLDPKADKPGHDEYSLTLKDFIKIFNLDKATLKMISMIKDESMKNLVEEFKENLKNGLIQVSTKPKLHHSP